MSLFGGSGPRPAYAGVAAIVGVLAGWLSPTTATAQSPFATCADCHPKQNTQFQQSVHQDVLRCHECHGGESNYRLSADDRQRWLRRGNADSADAAPRPFDHGETFLGKPARAEVPQMCGNCHADVARMNPYGLRTDQLAGYWVSGHGKRLREAGDERVAVCIDCHGAHDVIRKDDVHSRTHFRNIPATCGTCHGDPKLMAAHELSADIVPQYRASVHGRNVLERSDPGSPNCATCHGSHAAAPPGFAQVGHVCAQCHKQIADDLANTAHGRIAVIARCTGCHGKDGQVRNHQIEEATPPTELLVEEYAALRAGFGDDPDRLRERFVERVDQLPGTLRLDSVCANCHAPGRKAAHGAFFTSNDEQALARGREYASALRRAQFEYARAAERVDRIARGVLLVREEALQTEEVRTQVMALYSFLHSLNGPEILKRVAQIEQACQEVNDSLDRKQTGLKRRRQILGATWVFIAVFATLMYTQYRRLKKAYVRKGGGSAAPNGAAPMPERRQVLELALRVMGVVSLAGLLWPAVAYVLPASRRGGGSERISAGREDDWGLWDVRKVSVEGKVVAVLRTDKEYRAISLVCTHLGCIVHWYQARREFECPCHAAVFDATGAVVAGPPPKPLPTYNVAVVAGEVFVTGAAKG